MFVLDSILHRLQQGCQTMRYPQGPAPALPDRHGGALRVDAAKCAADCDACVPVCPTQAIVREPGHRVALDLGKCIFCAACVAACPTRAITQTNDHRMAVDDVKICCWACRGRKKSGWQPRSMEN